MTSLRTVRLGPFAAIDLVGSFVIAHLLVKRLHLNSEVVMWSVLPLSVAAHLLVSQPTPLTQMAADSRLVQLALVFMAYRALAAAG
jgi:hypothetical protein